MDVSKHRLNELVLYIKAGDIERFYSSTEWRKLREIARKRDHYECVRCKRLGKFHAAECVHHLIEVRVNPWLCLTLDNLMSLCNECHNVMHPEKLEKVIHKPRFMNEERW